MGNEAWITVSWGSFWFVFSLWASGFSFTHPRWLPPRVMWMSSLLLFMDRFFKRVAKTSILEIHEERNTFSWRLIVWALKLSDCDQLSYPQKLERAFWTQGTVVTPFLIAYGLAFASF
jgi:hypothetical protein